MKAFIAFDTAHGTILEVSLDNNGEPEQVKPILLEYYNTPKAILSLVGKGNLSILAESSECPTGHSFETPVKGHCVYYGRDRKDGERFNAVYFFGGHEKVSTDRMCHHYLFENGVWLYKSNGNENWSKL